ncbi:MAG: amidophosphoribosyltransferase [Clostridia bacterium]|nr:amidophosphoribosyltransferase [Clostridia bacterium]MBR4457788.1 amidophosphoribosyltransferase [Clostridia bacterium]
MHPSDKLHEECGVFGIYRREGVGVVDETYHALYALQHRGQESCGMAVNVDGVITCHKDIGLVTDVFTKDRMEKITDGRIAVGHCRYGTTGSLNTANAQPLLVNHLKGAMALCHNGNLTNAAFLRERYEMSGAIFHATSDSEVIAYTITQQRLRCASIEEAVRASMEIIEGAYCLVIMSATKLIAARDPHGFRPLCMGRIGEDIVFASETCALDAIGATFVRDIQPGEMVVVSPKGLEAYPPLVSDRKGLCVFEYIYFARPDSVVDGVSVHEARLTAGRLLARSHPVEADVVIGAPDSGLDAALGYSYESGIPYGIGLIKNKYIGRTFIQPEQKQRAASVRIKLNAVTATVKDRRVVLVDDSIVRGTTSARVVRMLREAGAREVHVVFSAPPFRHACYFGTDVDDEGTLIANQHTEEEICRIIGADSIGFLRMEDLDKLTGDVHLPMCKGCFNGEYPVPPPVRMQKHRFEIPLSRQKENENEE